MTADYHTAWTALKELFDRYLVVVALAYIYGIVIGRFWFLQSGGFYWLAAVLLLLSVSAVCFKFIDTYRAIIILIAAACGAGAFNFSVQQPAGSIASFTGSPVYIEGTVVEEPLVYDDHTAYRLRVEQVETKEGRFDAGGDVLVRIYGRDAQIFWFGEKLRLRGTVVEPRSRRNPGGFDYRFYLQSRGIAALIYPNPAQVSSLGPGETGLLTSSAVKLRGAMSVFIGDTLPSPSSELLTAILFGRRHHLPDEVERNFRRAGAGHLMAVSGLHVGLVAGLILGLWRRLNFSGRLPFLLAIVLVLAYAYLTGMRPSALRAAIMVSLALGALLLDRERDLPTAVSSAALITLFINPLLLFTVGFQLSYAATLFLVYAYRPLEHLLSAVGCPFILRPPLAVTMAAQAGVIPLCVYYFHHLPVAALLFNLLLLPLIAFVVGLGLLGAVSGLIWALPGEILLWAARPLLELMLYITGFSGLPGFYIAPQPPGLTALALFYVVFTAVLFFYYHWAGRSGADEIPFLQFAAISFRRLLPARRRRTFFATLAALIAALVIVWSGLISPAPTNLSVTFIDVGQGAAVLVDAPCGAVILIDAGGDLPFRGDPGDIGERVLMPFFRHQGINRLDLAVITHPHEDHFGGFIALVGALDIEKMLVSPVPGGPPAYIEMLERAREEGIPVIETRAGQIWQCEDGLFLEVLGPPEELIRGSGSELNDNSIVIMLQYGTVRMLFTGDIEDAAVSDLFKRRVNLKADLLQVPHHGGYLEAMPQFLDAVRPAVAVIQVGANPFGHPHPSVVEAIEQAGIAMYRNDDHGAVIVETDGANMWVFTLEQAVQVGP